VEINQEHDQIWLGSFMDDDLGFFALNDLRKLSKMKNEKGLRKHVTP